MDEIVKALEILFHLMNCEVESGVRFTGRYSDPEETVYSIVNKHTGERVSVEEVMASLVR